MPLSFLVFLGSARISTPPQPARLGLRVARACIRLLQDQDHAAELIDPVELKFEPVFKPHFAYAKGKAPDVLEALADKIERADAYVMVSPEYNHSMSPALSHMLNHFGSSLFSYKPSAIVTYSAGQWGGVRAAVGMRTLLAELGCLPVSAMIHVPKAQEIFADDGEFAAAVDAKAWAEYFARSFLQLQWWAAATQEYRERNDPLALSPAFTKNPEQRNTP